MPRKPSRLSEYVEQTPSNRCELSWLLLNLSNPTLGEALLSDTLSNSGQSLPANTCLFHPTAGESHPSRLRASISSLVTASASRPPNLTSSVFTCPTASLNLPSDAGESPPARQPYLFHPTADLPFRLYLSDTASLDLPSDAGKSLPARQPYLFKPVDQRGSPVRHGDLETSRTSTRASQTTTSPFLARQGLPVRHGDLETRRTTT